MKGALFLVLCFVVLVMLHYSRKEAFLTLEGNKGVQELTTEGGDTIQIFMDGNDSPAEENEQLRAQLGMAAIPENTSDIQMEDLTKFVEDQCKGSQYDQVVGMLDRPFTMIWDQDDDNRTLNPEEYNSDVSFYAYGESDELNAYRSHIDQVNKAINDNTIGGVRDDRCGIVREVMGDEMDKFIFYNNNKLLGNPDYNYQDLDARFCYIPPRVANVSYHETLCSMSNELIYDERFSDIIERVGGDPESNNILDAGLSSSQKGVTMCEIKFKEPPEDPTELEAYKERLGEYLQYLYKQDPERQYWKESTRWLFNKNYADQSIIARHMADKVWMGTRLEALQESLDQKQAEIDGLFDDPNRYINQYVTRELPQGDEKINEINKRERILAQHCAYHGDPDVDPKFQTSYDSKNTKGVGGEVSWLGEANFDTHVQSWIDFDTLNNATRQGVVDEYIKNKADFKSVWERDLDIDKESKQGKCESILLINDNRLNPESRKDYWSSSTLGFSSSDNCTFRDDEGGACDSYFKSSCSWSDLTNLDTNDGGSRRGESCGWATDKEGGDYNCEKYGQLFENPKNYYDKLEANEGNADEKLVDFLVDKETEFRAFEDGDYCVYRDKVDDEGNPLEGGCLTQFDERLPVTPTGVQLYGKGEITDSSYPARRSITDGSTNLEWGPRLSFDNNDGKITVRGVDALTFSDEVERGLETKDGVIGMKDYHIIAEKTLRDTLGYVKEPQDGLQYKRNKDNEYYPEDGKYRLPEYECVVKDDHMVVEKDEWVMKDNIETGDFVGKTISGTDSNVEVTCELDGLATKVGQPVLVTRDEDGKFSLDTTFTCDKVNPIPSQTVIESNICKIDPGYNPFSGSGLHYVDPDTSDSTEVGILPGIYKYKGNGDFDSNVVLGSTTHSAGLFHYGINDSPIKSVGLSSGFHVYNQFNNTLSSSTEQNVVKKLGWNSTDGYKIEDAACDDLKGAVDDCIDTDNYTDYENGMCKLGEGLLVFSPDKNYTSGSSYTVNTNPENETELLMERNEACPEQYGGTGYLKLNEVQQDEVKKQYDVKWEDYRVINAKYGNKNLEDGTYTLTVGDKEVEAKEFTPENCVTDTSDYVTLSGNEYDVDWDNYKVIDSGTIADGAYTLAVSEKKVTATPYDLTPLNLDKCNNGEESFEYRGAGSYSGNFLEGGKGTYEEAREECVGNVTCGGIVKTGGTFKLVAGRYDVNKQGSNDNDELYRKIIKCEYVDTFTIAGVQDPGDDDDDDTPKPVPGTGMVIAKILVHRGIDWNEFSNPLTHIRNLGDRQYLDDILDPNKVITIDVREGDIDKWINLELYNKPVHVIKFRPDISGIAVNDKWDKRDEYNDYTAFNADSSDRVHAILDLHTTFERTAGIDFLKFSQGTPPAPIPVTNLYVGLNFKLYNVNEEKSVKAAGESTFEITDVQADGGFRAKAMNELYFSIAYGDGFYFVADESYSALLYFFENQGKYYIVGKRSNRYGENQPLLILRHDWLDAEVTDITALTSLPGAIPFQVEFIHDLNDSFDSNESQRYKEVYVGLQFDLRNSDTDTYVGNDNHRPFTISGVDENGGFRAKSKDDKYLYILPTGKSFNLDDRESYSSKFYFFRRQEQEFFIVAQQHHRYANQRLYIYGKDRTWIDTGITDINSLKDLSGAVPYEVEFIHDQLARVFGKYPLEELHPLANKLSLKTDENTFLSVKIGSMNTSVDCFDFDFESDSGSYYLKVTGIIGFSHLTFDKNNELTTGYGARFYFLDMGRIGSTTYYGIVAKQEDNLYISKIHNRWESTIDGGEMQKWIVEYNCPSVPLSIYKLPSDMGTISFSDGGQFLSVNHGGKSYFRIEIEPIEINGYYSPQFRLKIPDSNIYVIVNSDGELSTENTGSIFLLQSREDDEFVINAYRKDKVEDGITDYFVSTGFNSGWQKKDFDGQSWVPSWRNETGTWKIADAVSNPDLDPKYERYIVNGVFDMYKCVEDKRVNYGGQTGPAAGECTTLQNDYSVEKVSYDTAKNGACVIM